ncbi:hypothetical protein WJX72_000225 [[Myrmecia] bisecta]|uniref:ER-bound oxygenase mpaB/mpaB'/Rubber oxygenase catalytic domain-containing protein n=1 Tax=[Myrmecia] bisecta TaxID=41462 RepID=A0AAW1QPD0_9CHLO
MSTAPKGTRGAASRAGTTNRAHRTAACRTSLTVRLWVEGCQGLHGAERGSTLRGALKSLSIGQWGGLTAALCCHVEFPTIYAKALDLALFRAFGVPEVSKVAFGSGEFKRDPAKRYADTDLLLCEMTEQHYASARGQEALRRLNFIHSHFSIRNDDMIYTLSLFILEPARWANWYDFRAFTKLEKDAVFNYWYQIGIGMDIRDIPTSYEALDEWNTHYEKGHLRFGKTNASIRDATLALMVSDFPPLLRNFARKTAIIIMDDPLTTAMGLELPPLWMEGLVAAAMWLRKQTVGWLLPPRPLSMATGRTLKTALPYCTGMRLAATFPIRAAGSNAVHAVYPETYAISDLGPPRMGKGLGPLGTGSGKLYRGTGGSTSRCPIARQA